MSQREIVVAVARDGNPERLVQAAGRIAASWGASLVVLHVMPLGEHLHADVVHHPSAHPSAAALLREAEEARLPWMVGLLAHAPGAVGLFAHGDPAQVIVAVAAERDAEAVVVGTHAREGLVRALLGSVAEAVVRHANVPVITVNSLSVRGEAPDGPASWPVRVLGEG